MLGVMSLGEAINLARSKAVDLVEIAPNATPPVCRLIAFGKYRYEMAKQEKESRKHQHANKVKEVQLSPNIDPHDFAVKLQHAVDFLCEDMKVKITLRFRGREMAHKELGFQQVEKFAQHLVPYGHPDAPPKLIGKGINVMLSPLPRAKRAKNPGRPSATSSWRPSGPPLPPTARRRKTIRPQKAIPPWKRIPPRKTIRPQRTARPGAGIGGSRASAAGI